MKVFLRNRTTGHYFLSLNKWIEELAQAHDFQKGDKAIDAAIDCHLTDAEMIYTFGNPKDDLVVSISPKRT